MAKIYKCEMCGASLSFEPGDLVTECEYCNSKIKLFNPMEMAASLNQTEVTSKKPTVKTSPKAVYTPPPTPKKPITLTQLPDTYAALHKPKRRPPKIVTKVMTPLMEFLRNLDKGVYVSAFILIGMAIFIIILRATG